MVKLGWPKSAQSLILLFILLSVPLVTIINQQVHNYQSAARERRVEEKKRVKTKLISGIVYEDLNENQIKDEGESGMFGVDVVAKIRDKNHDDDDEDEDDEDDNELDRREKIWTETKLTTGENGAFRLELPKNLNPRSSRFRLTVLPPAGYKLSDMKYRYEKFGERKKGERIVYIGLVNDGSMPSVTATPIPSATPALSPTIEPTLFPSTALSSTPTPELTQPPVMTPPVIPTSISSPTPEPTQISMSPTPTSIVCPPPPVCDGELVTIDQPSLICPIYFCYSIDPGQ